jgi:hypothetical protein
MLPIAVARDVEDLLRHEPAGDCSKKYAERRDDRSFGVPGASSSKMESNRPCDGARSHVVGAAERGKEIVEHVVIGQIDDFQPGAPLMLFIETDCHRRWLYRRGCGTRCAADGGRHPRYRPLEL